MSNTASTFAIIGTLAAVIAGQAVWIGRALGAVGKRIDDLGEQLGARITEQGTQLGARIDDMRTDLGGRLDRIEDRLGALERERS